jgi:hypothetical protein
MPRQRVRTLWYPGTNVALGLCCPFPLQILNQIMEKLVNVEIRLAEDTMLYHYVRCLPQALSPASQ